MAEFGSDKCKHQIPIQSVARPHDIISATGRGSRTLPGQYPIREEEVWLGVLLKECRWQLLTDRLRYADDMIQDARDLQVSLSVPHNYVEEWGALQQ